MSLAICEALMRSKSQARRIDECAIECMQKIGQNYPSCGYGRAFRGWLFLERPAPYNSFGNGAAMRVSGCGYAADSIDGVIALADAVTSVTHNHPEGIKGAEAVAAAVYLARTGLALSDIKNYISQNYYVIDFKLDDIRPSYSFDVSCQGSVPQALAAFFESTDFEDAIRNAVSIGGDSDTIAAIAGSVAGAYYGVPMYLKERAISYLDGELQQILSDFENAYLR